MRKFILTIVSVFVVLNVYAQEKNVAVIAPFDYEDKVELMYEKLIKSKLQEVIAEASNYNAFTRTDIDAIVDEQHFQRTGMVKDEEIRKIGEMTGATHICVSELTTADKYMTIAARIINIETAQVVREKSVFKKAEPEAINKGSIALASKLMGKSNNKRSSEKSTNTSIDKRTDNKRSYEQSTGTFIDKRDGQEYKWIKIGEQIWMAENLNYNQNSYGNDCCYDNDKSNCDTYGRLYDLDATMQGESSSNSNPSGVQGVCPDGWHVPSDEEWKELEMQLGMSQSQANNDGWRGTNEGSKLAGNASLWKSGDLTNDSKFGTSGFTTLPGGHRGSSGNFGGIGLVGYYWSSTMYSLEDASYRHLNYHRTNVDREDHWVDTGYGYSIRCARD
mgnify:CR=1 FL=1